MNEVNEYIIPYQLDGKPTHWRHVDIIKGAIERFLINQASPADLVLVREYCQHWIEAPGCRGGSTLTQLRQSIVTCATRDSLCNWISSARLIGIDPL